MLCLFFGDNGLVVVAWPGEASVELVAGSPRLQRAFASAGITPDDGFFIPVMIIGWVAASWMIWGLVFYRATREDDAEALVARAMRWLLRGSILNLLIAVPTHVVVRQRDDCCAPAASFWGMVTGFSVMLLSFGPGVFYLLAARRRRMKPRG